MRPDEFTIPCREIRQPAIINFFKAMVLKERHEPGLPQATAIQDSLAQAGLADTLDMRTWRGWFGDSPRRARRDSVAALDRYLDVMRDPARYAFPNASPTSQFFRDMLEGGLATDLLEPTAAKQPDLALAARAQAYAPRSALHLHLDAIEAAAMSDGNDTVSWEQLKGLAATRVLELLFARWSPRHGTVFRHSTPAMELTRRGASHAKSDDPRSSDKDADVRERFRCRPCHPNWSLAGIESDIAPTHVQRLLLVISADTHFLVEDRFEAWSLDLVSAGIASYALAWSDRFHTFGVQFTPEMIFWKAIEGLYFGNEPEDVVGHALADALDLIEADRPVESIDTLWRSREWYHRFLTSLGISLTNVRELVHRCWHVRPLTFHAKRN